MVTIAKHRRACVTWGWGRAITPSKAIEKQVKPWTKNERL
jgi:hypothetical protein